MRELPIIFNGEMVRALHERGFSMMIKAITLWQPWASFMALELKKNETRSWGTRYRGPLAIHAAAKIPPIAEMGVLVARMAYDHFGAPKCWVRGKVLCVVELQDIVKSKTYTPVNSIEGMLGDYSPGRYIWITKMLHIFDDAIPAKGSQGLWDWEWDK